MAGSRPLGVTIIGVIVIIEGILLAIGGVLGLFSRADGIPILIPIITALIGIIYIAIARGLFSGSGGARLIVGIVTIISLIAGIWSLLFYSGMRIQGLVQALIAVIILLVLYGPRAKLFFS